MKIIDKIEIYVLLDNYLVSDIPGLFSANGLSLFLNISIGNKKYSVLIDSGPNYKLLEHNAKIMNLELKKLTSYILTVNLYHHLNGFLGLINKENVKKLYNYGFIGKNFFFSLFKTRYYWNENIVVFKHNKGIILFFGCCIYGFEKTIEKYIKSIKDERIYGIIGGFGLSFLDVFSIRSLEKILERHDTEIILPLHSTAPRAREYLINEWNAVEGGVGTFLKI